MKHSSSSACPILCRFVNISQNNASQKGSQSENGAQLKAWGIRRHIVDCLRNGADYWFQSSLQWYGAFALAMVLSIGSAIPIVFICQLPKCARHVVSWFILPLCKLKDCRAYYMSSTMYNTSGPELATKCMSSSIRCCSVYLLYSVNLVTFTCN